MIKVKYCAFLFVVLCISFSCSKTENRKGVESFSSASFNYLDGDFTGLDVLLNNDGSLIIAGSIIEDGNILATVCVFEVNNEGEIAWLSFLPYDSRYVTSHMNLLLTRENEYLLVLNSKAPSDGEEYGIDIVRIDQLGNILSTHRIYEETKSLAGTSIIQLEDEDFIVFSEDQQGISSDNQLNLSKVSKSGDLIWSKLVENSIANLSRQLIYLEEDESIFGLSEHNVGLRRAKVQLHKFDLDGNLLWEQALAELSTVWIASTYVQQVNGDQLMASFTKNKNVTLMQIDKAGNIEWERNYEGDGSDISRGLIQTIDGNYVLLTNTTSYGNGGFDIMLTKVDENGDVIWDKTYGSSLSDHSVKMIERPNGDIVVIGSSNGETQSNSEHKLFILETDMEGNPK